MTLASEMAIVADEDLSMRQKTVMEYSVFLVKRLDELASPFS